MIELPDDRHLSRALRVILKKAGVTRPELFANDATRKGLTWYDLRATGITWMAIRGDDPLKIMSPAGHVDFATTQGYIREAEAMRAGFGDVFPPLPASTTSARRWGPGMRPPSMRADEDEECPATPRVSPGESPEHSQVYEIVVEAPGIEPGSARRPAHLRSRA